MKLIYFEKTPKGWYLNLPKQDPQLVDFKNIPLLQAQLSNALNGTNRGLQAFVELNSIIAANEILEISDPEELNGYNPNSWFLPEAVGKGIETSDMYDTETLHDVIFFLDHNKSFTLKIKEKRSGKPIYLGTFRDKVHCLTHIIILGQIHLLEHSLVTQITKSLEICSAKLISEPVS